MSDNLTPISQQADKITNIERVGSIHQTLFIMAGSDAGATGLSRDYYNLIVWGSEPFLDRHHVTISTDRALVEEGYTSPGLRAWLSTLDSGAMEALKTFPCIIANENRFYGHTDEEQFAVLAVITDVKKRSNGIEVYFQTFYRLPQQRLNELRFELGISGTNRFNEFNHSHWAVKEVDLLEVLGENGLRQI
ncbi:MAG: hypothetical protein IIZ39_03570 [Blautia sp.]|nr:hypothetical protein [Blautia sp.]